MDDRRTDDTIINSQIKLKKGELFTAFVDFRNFFDWIERDMLFYKLQKMESLEKFIMLYNLL